MNPEIDLDVVVATDLRLPGGTVASLVEELRSLRDGPWRVGAVQVPSRLVARPRPLHREVLRLVDSGEVRLVLPHERVRARLAVLRHPSVFEQAPAPAPRLRADEVVLVANQASVDDDGTRHYDPVAVDRTVGAWTGHRPLWAPIGPLVRAGLATSGVRLREQDWLNVIDVDEWAVDRSRFRGPVPVIGRHSRPQPSKWPARKDDLLAAYPRDGSVRVRVLGGAQAAADVLGRVPPAWEVEEFGSRHPREFLADLDFLVYYHREGVVEAFGRTVMEAMASGAVAVLDPSMRPSFGDHAVYAPPAEAMARVHELAADPQEYRARSAAAQQWVRDRLGHEQHVARVAGLLGEPAPAAPRATTAAGPPPPAPRRTPTVLFVTSNGAGMGHLTRLLAVARRSTGWCRPVFLSLSSAVPVVGLEGFAFEYFPSRAAMGVGTREWNPLFESRFRQALLDHRPETVVFDGTWPYLGLVAVRQEFPGTRFVWSRRAMWKQGTPPDQLEKARHFDLVIEPGELAAAYDRGPTTTATDAVRVPPVTVLEPGDLLDRATARHELGLPADGTCVLVQLGAGTINDIGSAVGSAVARLRAAGADVVVTRSPIAREDPIAAAPGVHVVSRYPLSRWFNAFDASVAAAGYNAFHECLAFGLPTAFVPNTATRTDDQEARARWAADQGCGWSAPEDSVADVVGALLDPDERARVRAATARLEPCTGARAAAGHLRALVAGR